MDGGRRSFQSYVSQSGDFPSRFLALASAAQMQVRTSGASRPGIDLPIERWAAEAGPEVTQRAVHVLEEWATAGGPDGGTAIGYLDRAAQDHQPDELAIARIAAWQAICQQARDWLAGLG